MKTPYSSDDLRAAVAYVERKLATQLWWLGEDNRRDAEARTDWPSAKRDSLWRWRQDTHSILIQDTL